MERPFQEGDIAENLGKPRSGRISFRPAAARGKHDEWQIRPAWLGGHPGGNRLQIAPANGLFGQHAKCDVIFQ